MKKLILCLLALAGAFGAAAQYQAAPVSSTREAVTLRCVGYGKKAPAASQDAELSAVKTLLFAGASGTPFSLPLIQGSQSDIEAKHKKFFEEFYESGYKSFVESSVVVTPFGKNELKKKCITVDVTIRAARLRAHLESNGIIRKFGL